MKWSIQTVISFCLGISQAFGQPLAVEALLASDTEKGVLSFELAIDRIVFRSTGVAEAQATLGFIETKNIPSRLAYFPTLSFDAKTALGGAANLFPMQQMMELSSQWNLFKWGADAFGMRASYFEQSAQSSRVDATVLEAEGEAVAALIGQIQRKKEVQIHKKIIKNQTELTAIAHQRYQAGYLPMQEAEKMTVDLANAQASLIDAQILETDAQVALEKSLGHLNLNFEWPWIAQLRDSEHLPLLKQEQVLSQRPDWLAAQSKVQTLDARVSQSWRLLLPSVDAQFAFGYYRSSFGEGIGWVGYVGMTLPLFDHATNYSQAKQQMYLRSEAEAQLEQVSRKAKAEWTASQKNFRMALESALSREKTLLLSRKLYQDNQRRFQAGRIDSNDLAVDRNRMFQAELNAVQGWSAAHLSFTQLCHALGYRIKQCLNGAS